MLDRFAPLLDALRNAVLKTPGALDSSERESMVEGSVRAGALGAFAIRVQENPSSITDEQVSALVRAGNSEDAIFEVIVCAALGSGLSRLKIGFDALEGKR